MIKILFQKSPAIQRAAAFAEWWHPRALAVSMMWAVVVSAAGSVSADQSTRVDFAKDIRPILNARCTECHGGVKAAGGVSFVYEDRVINAEGDSGSIVVKPGDVDASELFYRITSEDEDRMPPPDGHAALRPSEVELIRRWIQQGAAWNAHWAFEPPQMPALPETEFDADVKTNVDRFIFQRLQQEQLAPAEPETPGRLLRRLHLGLTGLPPTLTDYRQFEERHANDADAAVEEVVDRLLADPAFGERWASMWLDLVRYADSGGLGIDQRRTIWPYRDWVVKAFNEDLPFDEFTIKQLAGDLLPEHSTDDLIATACHRNTQTNNEGGTDDEQFRIEAVIDRVNTTWQTWGSLTFGCVQCHDHPYDPLRHEEYYRFVDFFNDTADSDLSNDAPRWKVAATASDRATADKLSATILDLKQRLWDAGRQLRDTTTWKPVTDLTATSNNGTRFTVEPESSRGEFHTVGTVETGTHTRLQLAAENFPEPVTALRLTVLPFDPATAQHSPEWGFLLAKTEAWAVTRNAQGTEIRQPVTFRWSVPDVAWMPTDPMGTIEPDGSGWGADSRIHHARTLVLIPDDPLPAGTRIELHFHCNKNGHGSHPMAIERGFVEFSNDSRWTKFAGPESPQAAQHLELQNTMQQLNKIPGSSIPVMLQRPAQLQRPTHLFVRGNMLEKANRVSAGLPAILTQVAPVTAPPNRLQMARWWVSENHPLTARVFVNRLWEQLFGVGIVPTLEDFGSSGEKPTHPELLDYLAVRFQRQNQWSVKAILKEIVLSHVFRQSSGASTELRNRDPDNRWLARGPRQRLTAEMVRDQALSVSGLLTQKIGGPPVHPPLPDGVWKPFDGGDKWKTPGPGDPNRYRRSIYTYIKRSIPYPAFATFDAPSREFCTPRRLTSNTPLQALVTLNDATFVETAEAFGRRLSGRLSGSESDRLSDGYLLVTGRVIDAEQLQTLQKLLASVQAHPAVAATQDSDSQTAWTVVAQVLLNLDETMTW